MNLKMLLTSLFICLFAIGNVNASEIETSEIVESEYVSIESEQVSEIVESEVSSEISVPEKVEVETRGSGYIPEYAIESVFKGEKLVTYYKDSVKYKAELFYASGEKHADYYYNTNGSWVKYVEYHKSGLKKDYQVRTNQKIIIEDYAYNPNGSVKEFIKRYDTGKMKEHAWYYESGKLKRIDNHYSNGRKRMYRTWAFNDVKADHQEYYNNSNNGIAVDYAYYSNGKVSEFIKRHEGGNMKERAWYYSSGQLKTIYNYYNNGRLGKVRHWGSNGVKNDHREYYNQPNSQIKADYAYFTNGKVSEFIKWKANGKRIEHVWIHRNGDSNNYRRIKRYNSQGKVYSDKYYYDRSPSPKQTAENFAVDIEKEINRVRKERGLSTLKTDNKALDGYCASAVDYYAYKRRPTDLSAGHPDHITDPAKEQDNLLILTNAQWASPGYVYGADYAVQQWTDSPGHNRTQYDPIWSYLDVKVKENETGTYIEACYAIDYSSYYN